MDNGNVKRDEDDEDESTEEREQSSTLGTVFSEPKRLIAAALDWIYTKLGLVGVIVALALILAALAWWNWDDVRKRPGVDRILHRIETLWSSDPAPVDHERVSVIVADFVRDSDHEFTKLLESALTEYFTADDINVVQVVRLGSEIVLSNDPDLERAIRIGHDMAKEHLVRIGGDVLIWGQIDRFQGESRARVFWTLPREAKRTKSWGRYKPGSDLTLPDLFWEDLTEILHLLVATRFAELNELRGTYVVDKVEPFVGEVRQLISDPKRIGWTSEARCEVMLVLADCLLTLGVQGGSNEKLREAEDLSRRSLAVTDRSALPLLWARAQAIRGRALWRIGEREGGTTALSEAVATLNLALEELPPTEWPNEFGTTKNDLGNALRVLGERSQGNQHLNEAVLTFEDALRFRRRDLVPLDWAKTHNDLGNALAVLGLDADGTDELERAGVAYGQALSERTRDRVPLDWAETMNNLGNVLSVVGERAGNPEHVKHAISAFRDALEERTRSRMPLAWAMTQNNLGRALYALGKLEPRQGHLESAIATYEEASTEATRGRDAALWATIQHNKGRALLLLGKQSSDPTDALRQAVDSFRRALEVRTKERQPGLWLGTTRLLAEALSSLGERVRNSEILCEALGVWLLVSDADREDQEITSNEIRKLLVLLRVVSETASSDCESRHREQLDQIQRMN